MLTPDEAVKIPPVLDLPPAPPPKFKAIMQRTPIQGCPRIVSIKKRNSGSYCVLLMGSNNIVVFLTICISYANNCFTL